MRVVVGLFILFLLAACGQGAQSPTATLVELPTNLPAPTTIPATLAELPTPDPNQAENRLSPGEVGLRDDFMLDRLPVQETNTEEHYIINAVKPVLRGGDAAIVEAFNAHVDALFNQMIEDFKSQAREAFGAVATETPSNTSSLDMGLDVFTPAFELISLRFPISIYMAGAAHPFSVIETLTYDLRTGNVLTLADVFQPGVPYLEFLSEQATNTITPILGESFFQEGALPVEENYRNWNLMPDGLVITFDQYQVGPGAAGPQEVFMPYTGELGDMLQPDILSTVLDQ